MIRTALFLHVVPLQRDSLEAPSGFEPENNGFADRRLTTWLWRPPTRLENAKSEHQMKRRLLAGLKNGAGDGI